MSKANRGKGTFERYNRGKGTCPVCGRTNIKATYEVEVGEKKFSVCKQCKAERFEETVCRKGRPFFVEEFHRLHFNYLLNYSQGRYCVL